MSELIPDLRSFDWVICSTSSGKDSQSTLRYVAARCKEAGVHPARIVAAHADLGAIEWPGCPELAGRQAEHYGVQLAIMKRNGGDLLEYARTRGKWPSPKQRWCTSDFKRGPIRRLMTIMATTTRKRLVNKRVRILNCMGMRAEESPARAKLEAYALDDHASNGYREVWNWLPIHQWPVEEVWSDIRKSGVPYHTVYDKGMKRLSCSFCIYAPKPALTLAGRLRPELLERYVQVEREIGHTFKSKLSLYQIQKAILAGEDTGELTDWRM